MADALADRITAFLETNPTWRPDAAPDSWAAVDRLRAKADVTASLSVDFLLGTLGAPHLGLAQHYAAKSHLYTEAAQHMGERLGGAL